MLSVEEAIDRILAGADAIGEEEMVPVAEAGRRRLARDLVAVRDQPPFDTSAMDGFAVRRVDVSALPAELTVVGEAAAGHAFAGEVGPREAVRIFTGAVLPAGADAIVIQENAEHEGNRVVVRDGQPDPSHRRPAGADFPAGETLLSAGRVLAPRDIMLAAAMGFAELPVVRKPIVAVLATGDELVEPGFEPGPAQIVSSNPHAIAAAMLELGAQVRLLGIARDSRESLDRHLALAEGADLLITIGGASVGDHDLVSSALKQRGMTLDFWRIAMRPGKPLLFGRIGSQRVIGVPGNPVSSLICTRLFAAPLIARLKGEPALGGLETRLVPLARDLPANGPREHYMRAHLTVGPDGCERIEAAASQDSSRIRLLSQSTHLIVRKPNAAAAASGTSVPVARIDF